MNSEQLKIRVFWFVLFACLFGFFLIYNFEGGDTKHQMKKKSIKVDLNCLYFAFGSHMFGHKVAVHLPFNVYFQLDNTSISTCLRNVNVFFENKASSGT